MRNRRTFLYRLRTAITDGVTEKGSRADAGARTKTDTGGQVEHTEAIGRTMVKELGILTP